ncbi:YheC/YheD family protein [Alicyclobacillus mali]|uniref:YheC/YheD family protein n=1 Tax=Alicyclobacillus mali (ex Roth et al. 2021) TaxID=1123961 RepID=A0ABS0F1K4_9BACL|nr:YheC/YheD family protein [Alicyclobacillus mali (ex Roth et al. 2021)]MBF8377153.1 YheC/YheD family protein [Alicyclobacillus mali (ex Roth et al. 2021)]MCL6488004.1 YheC/YheD family protein [Alicyclobacillus mali (ex Roth et al. 2021)]
MSQTFHGNVQGAQTVGEMAWRSDGPAFAIFTADHPSGFAGSRRYFRDIIAAGQKRGFLVYVITPQFVEEGSTWQGYVRVGYRNWRRMWLPRPLAVYNRIPNRALEASATVQRARATFEAMGIPFFNHRYFNKAKIYEAIRRVGLGQHLPETTRFAGAESVMDLLNRHGAVYLKPVGGSIGRGIVRVERRGDTFDVWAQRAHRAEHWSIRDAAALDEALRRARFPGAYVAQAAVPVIRFEGRPCDARVLLQRPGSSWQVVGYGIRVSGDESITTHVPNGGHIADRWTVLRQVFGSRSEEVDARLVSFTRSAAAAIERSMPGHVREMSIDVGIDEAGHPWLFEANAKPMRFDEPDIARRASAGVIDILRDLVRVTR